MRRTHTQHDDPSVSITILSPRDRQPTLRTVLDAQDLGRLRSEDISDTGGSLCLPVHAMYYVTRRLNLRIESDITGNVDELFLCLLVW